MSDNYCKSDSYIYMNIKQGNIDALKKGYSL
ncbi:ankyrin repeat protein [Magpiepox virus]|nr:ankyrin repeat protein [Magpiepox virus]